MVTATGRVTYGEAVREFRGGGIVLTETRHAAGLGLGRHDHEYANVNLVLSGAFRETVEQKDYDCDPQTAVLKPAGCRHSNHYGREPAHCIVLEFTNRHTTVNPEVHRMLAEHVQHRNTSVGIIAQQLYTELYVADASTPLIVEGLALQVLGMMVRGKCLVESGRRPPGWVLRTRDLIEAHPNARLRLSELAKVAGVHAAHLNRTFRRYFGTSIGAYSRDARLRFATQLLTHGSPSLSTVATQTGFCDQSHFSAAFKQRFGVTPGAFKRARHGASPA